MGLRHLIPAELRDSWGINTADKTRTVEFSENETTISYADIELLISNLIIPEILKGKFLTYSRRTVRHFNEYKLKSSLTISASIFNRLLEIVLEEDANDLNRQRVNEHRQKGSIVLTKATSNGKEYNYYDFMDEGQRITESILFTKSSDVDVIENMDTCTIGRALPDTQSTNNRFSDKNIVEQKTYTF